MGVCVTGEREGGRWRARQRERIVYVSGSACLCVNALTGRCKGRGRGERRRARKGKEWEGRKEGISICFLWTYGEVKEERCSV